MRRPSFVIVPSWVAWWVLRIQRVSPFYRIFSVCGLRRVWRSCLVFPGLSDAEEGNTTGVLSLHRETKFIIGLDFAVTLASPDFFLCSFRHNFRTPCRTEMANVKQTQKMIPFLACEISLCQYVCELVLGVYVFNLNLRVKIDSIEQPIKRNSVGPGNMSHCGISHL